MNRSWRQGTSRRRRIFAGGLITFALTTLTVLGYTSGGSFASNGYYYCPGGGAGGGYGGGYYGYCPPTTGELIVIKDVVNDNGGTAVASNFTLDSGGTNDSPDNFPGQPSPGTSVTLDPGAYNVTETGPAGYDASFSTGCSGTIAAGETKTCTVTNDDQPAHLIVVKHVINNDKGSATASDFTMTISGVTVPSGSSFPGAESPGTDKIVFPGSYSVAESGPSGYFTTFSADCTSTIALGQTKTCTVTNNDIGPRRTIGYWKTHEAEITPMLPVTLGPYSVATFAQSVAVFNATTCGTTQPGDAVGCLAGQLLAAKLNVANGNNPCIQPTIAKADSFLSGGTVTAGGVTATGVTYTGPGSYTLTTAQRSVALTLAGALDKYNNDKKGCANP